MQRHERSWVFRRRSRQPANSSSAATRDGCTASVHERCQAVRPRCPPSPGRPERERLGHRTLRLGGSRRAEPGGQRCRHAPEAPKGWRDGSRPRRPSAGGNRRKGSLSGNSLRDGIGPTVKRRSGKARYAPTSPKNSNGIGKTARRDRPAARWYAHGRRRRERPGKGYSAPTLRCDRRRTVDRWKRPRRRGIITARWIFANSGWNSGNMLSMAGSN